MRWGFVDVWTDPVIWEIFLIGWTLTLISVAATPDSKAFQDRRLFLEMTGDYRPKGANTNLDIDLGQLSDEQLERIAAGEDPIHVLASSSKSGT